MTKEVHIHKGIGVFGLLFVALTCMKLGGIIDLSWWIILALAFTPLLVAVGIAIVGLIVYFGVLLLHYAVTKWVR